MYIMLVLCSQVHISSLGRESTGSPILITENVTSATTHVTKVKDPRELTKVEISPSLRYLITLKWVLQHKEVQLVSFYPNGVKCELLKAI